MPRPSKLNRRIAKLVADTMAEFERTEAAEEAELTAALAAAHQDRRCGAKTRRGTPCRNIPYITKTSVPRCRLHGGYSTGPRTPEGRARIAAAQRKRWAMWRSQRGAKQ